MRLVIPIILASLTFSFLASASDLESEAKKAALAWLENYEYDTKEFVVEPECYDFTCDISVYPVEMQLDGNQSYRGCSLKICVTLVYSAKLHKVVTATHWR